MRYVCGIFLIFLVSVCSASRDLTNPCDRMRFINESFEILKNLETSVWIKPPYFYINCSCRGLTKVPGMLSSQVEFLHLNHNLIRSIKVGDVSKYVRTTVLLIKSNCARNTIITEPPCQGDLYIEPGALEPLINLRYLDISSNYLREFPFRLPSSITGLDISATLLGDVTDQLRVELPNLTTLFASHNCMQQTKQNCMRNFTISSNLASSLKVVDLSFNNWKEIPSYLFGSNLETLNLGMNPIGKIQKDNFVNATGLKTLIANVIPDMTELTLEPGALDPLTELTYLDLSFNAITWIPHEFFKHTIKLDYLDLSMNCLGKAIFQPTFLIGLRQLKYLDLSGNAYCLSLRRPAVRKMQLGNEYSNLKSLEYLMFGLAPWTQFFHSLKAFMQFSIKIHSIDSNSFQALSGLNVTVISLTGCSLQTIDSEAFKNMTKLDTLYLSYNSISQKDPNEEIRTNKAKPQILNYNSALDLHHKKNEIYDVFIRIIPQFEANNHVIDYSHNQITSISNNQVVLLEDVISLDLSHNQIEFIAKNDFENLQNLSYINLDYNPLQSIDPFAFHTLHSLKGLSLVETNLQLSHKYKFLGRLSAEAKVHLTWKSEGYMFLISLHAYVLGHLNEKFDSIVYADFSSNDFEEAFTSQFDVFKLFPSLVGLSLNNCDISDDVTTDLFSGLWQLKNLDFSHNLLHQLPTQLLQSLIKLTELDLSYNHITILTVELLANLSALERLSISNNKISSIEPGSFNSTKLRYLDLSSNYIQLLGADIVNEDLLESLVYFDIRWNELDCSCQVWETFYLWYISDESERTTLPGFMPTCTPEIDEYFGGCVACQSPLARRGRSVTRYGYNTSCELTTMTAYAASFTAFVVAFLLSGTIGYSKRFKRFVFRKINNQFRVQSIQEDSASRQKTKKTNLFQSFVFYDHQNPEVGDWVDFHLVPEMKRRKPFINLLVVGRDTPCGHSGGEQVLQIAMQCHKTMVILSEDFCDTPVCRFLISALQELQYSGGEDRLILITWYGDRAPRVPELIQRTMNRRRYCFLRFDHANDDEVLFFETLRTHLLSNNELSSKL